MLFLYQTVTPLSKYWRGHGFRIVFYLDDGVCSVQGDRAEAASEFVKNTLEQAGFVAHPVKSQWTPSYQVSWLRFNIDLLSGAILVPKLKMEAIIRLIGSALKQEMLSVCLLASIIGKIISLPLAGGPVACIMT